MAMTGTNITGMWANQPAATSVTPNIKVGMTREEMAAEIERSIYAGAQTAGLGDQEYGEAHARMNTPEWQAEVEKYNRGEPYDPRFTMTFKRLQGYFEQGQANPGNLKPELGQAAYQQWDQDLKPDEQRAKFNKAMDIVAKGTIGLGLGAMALPAITGGGAGAAAGGEAAGGAAAGGAAGGGGVLGGLGGIGATVSAINKGIEDLPGTKEDINRAIQNLPGTKEQAGALLGAGAAYAGSEEAKRAAEAAAEQAKRVEPWYTTGRSALEAQSQLMGLSGTPEQQLAALQSSPGYQFRRQMGERQLTSGLAARGGMGSGKAATSAQQWGQGFASQEYANRLAQLGGLSSQGYLAGANLGQELGTAELMKGQARQAGLIGAGEALTGATTAGKVKKPSLSDIYKF